jgi:hypothetical protein
MKRIALMLLIALFALPLWGQNSMTVYLLVKATPAWNPDDPMVYGRGFPVYADITNQYIGSQVLPDFVQFIITDADSLQFIRDAYVIPWRKALEWDVADSDMATDTHTLKAYVKPEYVSASGLNRLTREGVEEFLNNWGATVDSIALGEVTFTANVYEAIKSDGFWERNVQMFAWTEVGYDAPTGIHRVRVNYTGYTINLAEYAAQIINRGCEIVSNQPAQKRVTFDCSRQNVFNEFKQSVKERFDGNYAIRKWNFLEAAVDAAIAAGGSLEVTKAQVLNYIHNRLDD